MSSSNARSESSRKADALDLYFGGPVLAMYAPRPMYLLSHFVKLLQFFKSHGVGAHVINLLTRIMLYK